MGRLIIMPNAAEVFNLEKLYELQGQIRKEVREELRNAEKLHSAETAEIRHDLKELTKGTQENALAIRDLIGVTNKYAETTNILLEHTREHQIQTDNRLNNVEQELDAVKNEKGESKNRQLRILTLLSLIFSGVFVLVYWLLDKNFGG